MDKKQVFKDFFIYSAGNYISQALGMVSAFLLRAFLEPYYMGIWQGLNIIKSYTSYTNLGVSRSAAREIAYLRGKRDYIKTEILKNISFTFSLIMIFSVSLVLILFALIRRNYLNKYVFWGLIVTGIIIILERIESFIITILRSKKNFFPESLGKIINAILNIGLIILFVKNFELFGLYITNTTVFICSILILIWLSKESFKLMIKIKELKHLIKIGIPLVLLGFMFVNLTNIDRIVTLKMLGTKSLGLYSIAIMMGNLVYNISNMAGIVLYPRFQELYGRSDSKREIYIMMKKIIKFLWLPLLILVLGGIFLSPYLIRTFIPKYIPGIISMKIFLCGIYFLSLSIFCNHFLVTINKQIISLFICILIVILNLTLNILFVKLGFDIGGIALATSISYFVYFYLLLVMVYRYAH